MSLEKKQVSALQETRNIHEPGSIGDFIVTSYLVCMIMHDHLPQIEKLPENES